MLILVESTNQTGEKKKNQIREPTANSTHISAGMVPGHVGGERSRHCKTPRRPWIALDKCRSGNFAITPFFLSQLGKREAKDNGPLRKKKEMPASKLKVFDF